MGTILAGTQIAKARKLIQDATGTRWNDAELLDWLNDGQRQIVLFKPESNMVNETVTLSAGTKQSIPVGGIKLIDVIRNMVGAGNTTPGRIIELVNKNIIDATQRDWHSAPANASGEVDCFVFNHLDPKTFYVYPQPPATPQGVEIVYSAIPAEVPNITTAISLDDIYANALLDYILFKAYSKDADHAANMNRAQAAHSDFQRSLGMQAQSDAATDPNNNDGQL